MSNLTFCVSLESQYNTSKEVPNDVVVYVGKQACVIATDEINGTFLSNNYVLIPHHSWSDLTAEFVEVMYEAEEADLMIVKCSDELKQQSLYPAAMYHKIPQEGINFQLSVVDNSITSYIKADNTNFLFEFNFSHELKSGDSGTIIRGTTELLLRDNLSKCESVDSPLFMIIARKNDEYRRGLAIYLPAVLAYVRHMELNPFMEKPDIIQLVDMAQWCLITTPAEIKKRALSLPKVTAASFEEMVTRASGIDEQFLKYIDSRKTTSKRCLKLYYGFALATDNGSAADKCWVIDYELKFHASSNGYYNIVGKVMREANITNCLLCADGKTVQTYSESTKPICVDSGSYANFGKDIIFACHHPFFCERNDSCRGLQKKENGVSSWLTHCCIRPSHLVRLNKEFNDLGRVLQNQVDNPAMTYYCEKRKTTVTWT